jgi:hypothetical protein
MRYASKALQRIGHKAGLSLNSKLEHTMSEGTVGLVIFFIIAIGSALKKTRGQASVIRYWCKSWVSSIRKLAYQLRIGCPN